MVTQSQAETWEPTLFFRYEVTDKYWPNPQLQQMWKCLETEERKWKAVPFEVTDVHR